jgi:hypothetical protein
MSGSSGKFSYYSGDEQGTSIGLGNSGSDPITATLEDVQSSSYYLKGQKVPSVGENVHIEIRGRIAVISTATNDIIGYLSAKYNYLVDCIKLGKNYKGQVTHSTKSPPVPRIVVDLSV